MSYIQRSRYSLENAMQDTLRNITATANRDADFEDIASSMLRGRNAGSGRSRQLSETEQSRENTAEDLRWLDFYQNGLRNHPEFRRLSELAREAFADLKRVYDIKRGSFSNHSVVLTADGVVTDKPADQVYRDPLDRVGYGRYEREEQEARRRVEDNDRMIDNILRDLNLQFARRFRSNVQAAFGFDFNFDGRNSSVDRGIRARERVEIPTGNISRGQVVENILNEVGRELREKGYLSQEIKRAKGDDELSKGAKLTATDGRGRELEVMFMPNGEIATHAEGPEHRECQELAEETQETVLSIAVKVASNAGWILSHDFGKDKGGGGAGNSIKSAAPKPASVVKPQPKKLRF